MIRCLRFALALLAVAGLAAPAAAQRDVKFVLDWAFQSNHAFFTLADDTGLFNKEGLRVKIDRGYGSADTINKVAAGTYEFGFADMNLLVEFNSKNPDNKVIAVFVSLDSTLNGIVALAKSGIRTPKDLEGKRIAAPAADNSRVLFPIFATANKIDAASIRWLSVQPNVRDGLLMSGEADAVASFTTTTILALEALGIPQKDLVVMRYADLGVDMFATAVVVAEKFALANPDLVRGFIRAAVAGTKASLADQKASIASIKKRDSLIKEDVENKRFDLVRDLAVVTPSVKANGLSHVDPARLARTIGFVAQSMAGGATIKPTDVFRGDWLPPQADRKL